MSFETEEFLRIQGLVTPPVPEEPSWKPDSLDFMVKVGKAPTFYGQAFGVIDHLRECGLNHDLCETPGEDRIASFEGTEEEPRMDDAISAKVTCRTGCTCTRRPWRRGERLCDCGHVDGSTIAIPPMSIGQLLTMVDAWKTDQGR